MVFRRGRVWPTSTSIHLVVLPLLLLPRRFVSFSPIQKINSNLRTTISAKLSDIDYEYIPPNQSQVAGLDDVLQLPSVYPVGTPSGLRGEAVRSAILSGRCIAWDLSATTSRINGGDDGETNNRKNPIASGWISVKGEGTLGFLESKLSQSFSPTATTNNNQSNATFTQACLLTPKGRIVDQVSVALLNDHQAFMITSPGCAGSNLYNRLDPLIFPLDQVTLTELSSSSDTKIFSVASTSLAHVEKTIQTHLLSVLLPLLGGKDVDLRFPSSEYECVRYSFLGGSGGDDATTNNESSSLMILPQINLPSCACRGYTLVFSGDNVLARDAWKALVGDGTPEGPVEIGPLEYETLRIEAGWPGYGKELTGGDTKNGYTQEGKRKRSPAANPMELYWQSYVNSDKGCYLGQEGIANVLNNKYGPVRTLYSVVFEDDDNVYDFQSEGEYDSKNNKVDNLTVLPRAGMELFVLGSNEEISVGTLTSVAALGGTGEASTVALALVKRSRSIFKEMKGMDLDLVSSSARNPFEDDLLWSNPSKFESDGNDASGIIQPPPLDPLDGLEVIVGGTFTIGALRGVPSRRYIQGQNMFQVAVGIINPQDQRMDGSVVGLRYVDVDVDVDSTPVSISSNDTRMKEAYAEKGGGCLEQATKGAAQADADAAEAKRKADKMKMLTRRAEEAMAKRKNNNDLDQVTEGVSKVDTDAVTDAETKRKADKMDILMQRAEEAMARKKRKK